MAKRNFAFATLILVAWACPASSATKNTRDFPVDGCALLMSAVKSSVGSRNPYSLPVAEPDVAMPSRHCRSTVASTTSAFKGAMLDAGISISWQQHSMVSGDFCFSHRLSECYPRVDFSNGGTTAAQANVVAESWLAVRKSVSSFSPYGSSGDTISFDENQLRKSLRIARVTNRTPGELRQRHSDKSVSGRDNGTSHHN